MGADLDINGFHIFLTFFLVLLNGFFVAAEFAIVRVRGSQIEIQAKAGSRMAKVARGIMHNLDGYLAATQLGITIASLGLGWAGEEVMSQIMRNVFSAFGADVQSVLVVNSSHVVAFITITVLHIVFGELAPKTLAIQRSVRTAMAVSYPLRFFFVVFRPAIWLLNTFANFILRLFGVTPVHGDESHHSSEEMQCLLSSSLNV